MTPGACPAVNPESYLNCRTVSGDFGAVRSGTIESPELNATRQLRSCSRSKACVASRGYEFGSAGDAAGAAAGAGARTVIAEVPCTPSDVAESEALPPPTAVAYPLDETVTTDVLLLAHEMGRPVRTFPFAS